MKKALLPLTTLFMLSGCATNVAKVDTANLAEIDTNTKSIIIFDMSAGECVSTGWFKNIETGESYSGEDTAHPFKNPNSYLTWTNPQAVIVVPPGQYKLDRWSCVGENQRRGGNASKHFEPITVNPGEAVYPGSYFHFRKKVKYIEGQENRERTTFERITDPFGRMDPNVTYINAYGVRDNTEKVQKAFQAVNEDIASRFVTRLAETKKDGQIAETETRRRLTVAGNMGRDLDKTEKAFKKFTKEHGTDINQMNKEVRKEYRELQLAHYKAQKDFLDAHIAYKGNKVSTETLETRAVLEKLIIRQELIMDILYNRKKPSTTNTETPEE